MKKGKLVWRCWKCRQLFKQTDHSPDYQSNLCPRCLLRRWPDSNSKSTGSLQSEVDGKRFTLSADFAYESKPAEGTSSVEP